MPPALSDDEGSSSGEETLQHVDKGKEDAMSDVANGEDDGDEDGDEPEEYIVEAILSHAFDDDVLKYEVKWQGYEKKSDRTWEPEDNLSGAKDLLKAYHKKVGGRPKLGDASSSSKKRKESATPNVRPTPKQGRKKTKASKNGDDEDTPTAKKEIKTEKQWSPPLGLWEDDIISVESVEKSTDVQGQESLLAYVRWSDDRKSQHTVQYLYKKCPQKMLQYYERHLVFKDGQEQSYEDEDEY